MLLSFLPHTVFRNSSHYMYVAKSAQEALLVCSKELTSGGRGALMFPPYLFSVLSNSVVTFQAR